MRNTDPGIKRERERQRQIQKDRGKEIYKEREAQRETQTLIERKKEMIDRNTENHKEALINKERHYNKIQKK